MQRLSADSRIWIAFAILMGLLIVSMLSSDVDRRGGLDVMPRRSTFISQRDGYRALYTALQELGYRARRFRKPLTSLAGPGVLVLAEPEPDTPVTGSEWGALLGWVANGNLLIVNTDSGAAVGVKSTAAVNPRLDPSVTETEATPIFPTPVRGGASALRARSGVRILETTWSPPAAGLARPGKHPSGSIPLVPLYGDEGGPVLVYGKHGGGTVILCGSAWSFSNDGVGRADNFLLLTHLIDVYGGGKQSVIWFDEFHHGYGERATLIGLLPELVRVGLGHFALALLLLLLAGARRFGAPRLLPELERRSRAEYLTSMAGLFQRVRAWDAVFHRLHALCLREMTRDLGLPPGAGQSDVVRAAAERRGLNAQEVREILDRAGRAGADRGSRRLGAGEALALARQLVRLRQECRRTA